MSSQIGAVWRLYNTLLLIFGGLDRLEAQTLEDPGFARGFTAFPGSRIAFCARWSHVHLAEKWRGAHLPRWQSP
jgi:hypothetical protein